MNFFFLVPLQHHWQVNAGKCGTCGDPWDGERKHEAGGTYANGIVVAEWQRGAVVEVEVNFTANHKGWNEFQLCPVNNPAVKATEECFER